MRTLTFGIQVGGEVFPASVSLTDEYFTDTGLPKWHLLNARFSAPVIHWHKPLGAVPKDEEVVYLPNQPIIPISEELQKLREIVASLEKKVVR